MGEIIVESSGRSGSKPRWHVLVSDFANMVKAFIGSNYLTIAYAFTQSGLVMGIISLVIIAIVTDHCCSLIVKCKYHSIRHVVNKHKGGSSEPMFNSDHEGLLSSSENDKDGSENWIQIQKQMTRSLTYGDIGKIACGSNGLLIVNICLIFTQFGFCVSYFIFIGNTLFSLFPFRNTTIGSGIDVQTSAMPFTASTSAAGLSYNDSSADILNATVLTASTFLNESLASSTQPMPIPMWNISHHVSISEAPNLSLLVLTPFPIFVGLAFLRDIRHLGGISVGANISIFLGCIITLSYVSIDFAPDSTWELYNWEHLPIFFGMVTSSYEGIGTMLPIESSMEGNRHNFTRFLHGAVFILTSMLSVFGVLGYLRYGQGTEQMLNKNIPGDTSLGFTINICLCVGVILTFPLQIFPVIELMEIYTFGDGRLCGPKNRSTLSDDDDDDYEASIQSLDNDREVLLPKSEEVAMPVPVAATVSDTVAAWKRNILRLVVVAAAAGLAIVMKDMYAYVSAFVGAVGSSLLAYILPCIFHLKLSWHEMRLGVKIKDFFIIIFGCTASIASLYATIQSIVERFQ